MGDGALLAVAAVSGVDGSFRRKLWMIEPVSAEQRSVRETALRVYQLLPLESRRVLDLGRGAAEFAAMIHNPYEIMALA